MKRWLVPEVIQSSAMDCGPAVLKGLFLGYGIKVGYDRLRTDCATDVDGTSIDALEQLANQYGLRAEQVLVPIDHLPLKAGATLPAIAVTKLRHGGPHFVLLWSATSGFVQVMDPGIGRRWLRWERFLEEVYIHEAVVPAAAWREWAGGEEFLAALKVRLWALAVDPQPLLRTALGDDGPARLSHLDAALRMVTALVRNGGVKKGQQAAALLAGVYQEADANGDAAGVIPAEFYSARPAPGGAVGEPAMMTVRGVVLVQAPGAAGAADGAVRSAAAPLQPEELREEPTLKELWAQLDGPGRRVALLIPICAALAALGESAELVLLRAMLEVAPQLGLPGQRLLALAACLLLCLSVLAFDLGLSASAFTIGRRIELRLRLALLSRLPRLGESYFGSRAVSDLADRSHQLFRVREVPVLLSSFLRTLGQLLFTTLLLVWLDPRGAPAVLFLAALAAGFPVLLQPLLVERDLRARSHQGALGRFHLDTLLGTIPLRAHGAEAPLRAAHEDLLSEWAAARRSLGRAVLLLFGGQGLACTVLLSALWVGYPGAYHDPSGLLVVAYLSLNVPALGHAMALYLRQYPALRSILLRLLEPLHAKLEEDAPSASAEAELMASSSPLKDPFGVEVVMSGVELRMGGQSVLREVELRIPPGSHVAIVGVSGAGKSTLLGTLLGLYRPAEGSVKVDGTELTGQALARLRRETAWVDPAVQLHNHSLLANLRYGGGADPASLPEVLALADLEPVVARLPAGLQTPLGEGGTLLSGGEGQRVRLGRALSRAHPRLVLLDEPFRGLGRAERRELLRRLRTRFAGATLLCVTHDLSETLDFPRVLVIDAGRIAEDGAPGELRSRPAGHYRALLAAEAQVAAEVWGSSGWRRLRLANGQLREES